MEAFRQAMSGPTPVRASRSMARTTSETAEKHRFILAYPNAIDRSWGLAQEKVKKDLDFFDALLERVSADFKIDANCVYVLGMSNGGYFAHLVGKERSKKVAAVASHSA